MGFKSVGKRAQNCDMEFLERRWCQSKPTDRWYLELVVKRLRCINFSNPCTDNCASFRNCGMVPSFHIKMMRRRTIQACSLIHSIKNGKFLFWTNWTYLSRAGGVLPLPLPPLWLQVFVQVFSCKFYQIFQSNFLEKHVRETASACIHGIRVQKNPQTREDIFCIFTDFHGVLAPPHGNFINGVANS